MSAQISLTREQYLDSIRQLRAAASELSGRLNMTQMTFQPGGGERWSVSECFDHLAISNGLFLDSMEPAIGDARPGRDAALFRTEGFLSKKFVRDAEPPPRTKFRAPAKISPRPTLNSESILPRFLESLDRVSKLVGSSAGKDLNIVRFSNPAIPVLRFTVGTGFLLMAAHCRRHVWQAEQVLKEPDFPR